MTFAFNKIIQDSKPDITGGFNITIHSLLTVNVVVEKNFHDIASQ